MSKNTRWALAIVGVVIIVVAAVVVGTGKDNPDATPTSSHEHGTTEQAAPTGQSGATGQTGSAGSGDQADESGGASPDDGGDGDGGAGAVEGGSGGAVPQDDSGGAKAQTGVISPLLTPGNPRKVKVNKGDTVVIRARSPKASTLHVHGYDQIIELKAGQTGRLRFVAKIDGEFAIEFHYPGSESPAGTLLVNP